MSELILAKNITKVYRSGQAHVVALKDVSLEVKKGDFLGVFGPSGSGKSTLLHILGTLDKPTKGEIIIMGVNPATMSDSELSRFRNKKIGFVFQFHHLLRDLTALENVMLPMRVNGVTNAREKAIELLEEMGMGHRLHHHPDELSGGENQRVAVARALANDPDILLADEPTGNLDTENEENLLRIFKELNESRKMTVVLVSHNLDIREYCDKVFYLKDGVLYHED